MSVQIVKIFLKNGYYNEGRFVSKDDKFIHYIDRKTGFLRITNLDEVISIDFIDEVEE